MKLSMYDNTKAILMIHSGAVGDFVLTLPAVAALRRRFPRARITLAGRANVLDLAVNSSCVDRTLDLEKNGFHRLFTADEIPAELVGYLSAFDLIVSWFGAGDATYTVNLRRCNARSLIARPFPSADTNQHVADHLLSTLAPLGIAGEDATPTIRLNASARARGAEILAQTLSKSQATHPVVAVHTGSGSLRKCWPAENFARLIDQLVKKQDATILLIQGPDEDSPDAVTVKRVLARVRHAKPLLVMGLNLTELAGVLVHGRCFVGNDSGVTHLAAAVGTPVVAIFGVTDPRVWGPRGERVHIVYRGLGSLDKISVQEVLEKVLLSYEDLFPACSRASRTE